MDLGKSLAEARRKSRLSQEAVAESLGVSRQTVSKWEIGQVVPNIAQCQKLAALYRLSLDELVQFDNQVQELQRVIRQTSEEVQQKVDWSKLWAQKYPILASYQQQVAVEQYAKQLEALLAELRRAYGYSREDAFLVLKDILGRLWTGQV